MLDYINYYYGIYPPTINEVLNGYSFYVDSEKYYFIIYNRELDELDELVKLNKFMIENGSLVHEIISNRFNETICNFNNNNYILMRVYVNENKIVSIDDICYFINNHFLNENYKKILRTNWALLWENKVDYLEYQIGHLIKKYPFLYNTIDYYLGLSENAITYYKNLSYFNNNIIPIGILHKRIKLNSTLFDLYNPLNLIIDFKVRDFAEYIKDCLINDGDYKSVIDKIFKNYFFDKLNLSLFLSRLLFPSYFFDNFDNIIRDDLNENIIIKITKKSSKIEDLIKDLIKSCNLPSISWLTDIR